jgi:hypothetical protein
MVYLQYMKNHKNTPVKYVQYTETHLSTPLSMCIVYKHLQPPLTQPPPSTFRPKTAEHSSSLPTL